MEPAARVDELFASADLVPFVFEVPDGPGHLRDRMVPGDRRVEAADGTRVTPLRGFSELIQVSSVLAHAIDEGFVLGLDLLRRLDPGEPLGRAAKLILRGLNPGREILRPVDSRRAKCLLDPREVGADHLLVLGFGEPVRAACPQRPQDEEDEAGDEPDSGPGRPPRGRPPPRRRHLLLTWMFPRTSVPLRE